jgi:hypothetical protein
MIPLAAELSKPIAGMTFVAEAPSERGAQPSGTGARQVHCSSVNPPGAPGNTNRVSLYTPSV